MTHTSSMFSPETIKGAGAMFATVMTSGGVAMLAEAITDSTTVTVTIMAAVGGGCWYLASTFQKLKDGQQSANKRLRRIEEHMGINRTVEEEEDDEP